MIIKNFNPILIWPLGLNVKASSPDEVIKNILLHLADNWEEVSDLFGTPSPEKPDVNYSSFVYFHPFVQEFLFSNVELSKRPVRVLRRKLSKKELTVEYQQSITKFSEDKEFEKHQFTFDINDIYLYLFDTNIALLVTDLKSPENPMVKRFISEKKIVESELNLYDVETIQDGIRRVYAPYLQKADNSNVTTGGTLVDIFIDTPHTQYDFNKYIQWVQEHKTAPMHPFWADLIAPFTLMKKNEQNMLSVHHLLDDRQILLSHIGGGEPKNLTKGDFVRLGFADNAGSSDTLPYGEKFLENFEDKYCYDRFWDLNAVGGYPKDTRYLVSEYCFISTGNSANSFFTGKLYDDMRFIYTNMIIIAAMQKASLLAFEKRISEIVRNLKNNQQKEKFIQDVEKLNIDFIEFTTRYWINEVTNQEQGKELFSLFQNHNKINELYDLVNHEIQSVHTHISALQEEKRNKLSEIFNFVAFAFTILNIFYFIYPNNPKNFCGDTSCRISEFKELIVCMGLLIILAFFPWLKRLFSNGHNHGK